MTVFEELINRIHESKAGVQVRADAIKALRDLQQQNEKLRNENQHIWCEVEKLRTEDARLWCALHRIGGPGREITYCRDGHEEAVLHARAALNGGRATHRNDEVAP